MDIAVLGTGTVGRTLAAGLRELGHDVRIGTRDPAAARARTEPDANGTPAFSSWLEEHSDVTLVDHPGAVREAQLVVLATSGAGALPVLDLVGPDLLTQKVLLDVSNPLDFSQGFPPTLFVSDTDSLAEQIQRHCPQARVVKSLNTLTAELMVHPDRLSESGTVFVSGDDADAKSTVTALLGELGHRDVVDLGHLSTARGAEMWLPLWLRLMQHYGDATFNLRIVR